MAGEFQLGSKLLRRGVDINWRNREGMTALSYALIHRNLKMVQFLIENGADPHIEDSRDHDSCDYAQVNGIDQFAELNYC